MSIPPDSPIDQKVSQFVNLLAGCSDAEFVVQTYEKILGRGIDETGYVSWLTNLYNGLPRQNLVAEFIHSDEFQKKHSDPEEFLFQLNASLPAVEAAPPIERVNLEQYQDIWIHGKVALKGIRECKDRYEIIRNFCQQYQRPFTVLDIGANLGYFSIRLAEDFDCTVVAVEGIYGEWLQEILQANQNKRVILLQKLMSLADLCLLAQVEHFDVVLALSVIHHFPNEINESLQVLMSLGDHLILELPYEKEACGQEIVHQVGSLSLPDSTVFLGYGKSHLDDGQRKIVEIPCKKKQIQKAYLGSPRGDVALIIESDFTNKTVSFLNKPVSYPWARGINLQTYLWMNGSYPTRREIAHLIEQTPLPTTPHRDIQPWNTILQGDTLLWIDKDDPNHAFAYSDTAYRDRLVELLKANSHFSPSRNHVNPDPSSESEKEGIALYWMAPFLNYSGYGAAARFYAEALHSQNIPIQAEPFGTNIKFIQQMPEQERNVWLSLLNSPVNHGMMVISTTPVDPYGYPVLEELAKGKSDFNAYIGYTVCESTRIPQNWVDALQNLDDIWVPSRFCKEAFIQSGLPADQIAVIPHGIDCNVYNPATVHPLSIEGLKGFVFLSIFEWSLRKGWDVLLAAYHQAFTASDDVTLLIRSYRSGAPAGWIENQIETWQAQHGYTKENAPHILVLDRFLSLQEMPALYAAANAFVLPSRGEGFGLPYVEAMAMELPTVGTKWGGNLEFMHPDNSYLIACDEVPVPAQGWQDNPNAIHYQGQVWAEPSAADLAAILRQIQQNPEQARQKGQIARTYIQQNLNPIVISNFIISRLGKWKHAAPKAYPTKQSFSSKSDPRTKLEQYYGLPGDSDVSTPPQHKVLFAGRPDLFSAPADDTYFLLEQQAKLRSDGFSVSVTTDLRLSPLDSDLIHILVHKQYAYALQQLYSLFGHTQATVAMTPFQTNASQAMQAENFSWKLKSTFKDADKFAALIANIRENESILSLCQGENPYLPPDFSYDLQELFQNVDHILWIGSSTAIPNIVDEPPAHPIIPIESFHFTPPISQSEFSAHSEVVFAPERICPENNQLLFILALQDTPLQGLLNTAGADPDYLKMCQQVASPQVVFREFSGIQSILEAGTAARTCISVSFREALSPEISQLRDQGAKVVVSANQNGKSFANVQLCDPFNLRSIREAILTPGAHPTTPPAPPEREMPLQPAAPLSKIYRKIITTPAKAPGHSRPTSKDILQKAYTLIYAQNHPAAIQLLKPLKGVAPLLLLGDLYTLDKEYERALQCYVQAAQIQPDRISIRIRLANLYPFLGAPEKIEQELKKCLEISAFNWEGYHRLSQLYWDQKEHQKAIQWLKQGLQLLPDNLNLIIDLADHYKAIQDYATAQQFYRSALELNSSITPVVAQFLHMQTRIEAQQRQKESPQPHPSTQRPDPQALLEALLNSEDLVAAIEMHRSEMDLNFIKVIEENRQAALAEGFQELAEGLEALIEYIGVVPGYE